MSCLDDNLLAGYLRGELDPAAAGTVEEHLETCVGCRELLAWSARALDLEPASIQSGDATVPEYIPRQSTLRRGGAVGRYLLVEPIGRGAMGVVWSAYDPELDRRVAVKLVRLGRDARGDESEARARITREAQALARLSHPNVIAVYDVGAVEHQVFIAMEQVHGSTLIDWLAAETRSTAEILDVFHQAGRGLAAAHAAGLVHRDFKPANVLVGDDRRVRVVDFGFARATEAAMPAGASALAVPITRRGAIIGTPAYMAPEQRAGLAPDARADQYSFCVALCEALTGRRPVDRRDPALQDRRISAWMQKLLIQGLEVDPARRFSSMDDLLGAMEHDPGVIRRRRIGVVAAVAVVVVSAFAVRAQWKQRLGVCSDAEGQLAGVWDASRKRALGERFRTSDAAYAPEVLPRVTELLDRYAETWVGMQREACAATRVRNPSQEDPLEMRMACLTERREELRAAVDVMLGPDPSSVRNSVAIGGGLLPLSECSDVGALRGVVRPPSDETTRRLITTLGERAAAARFLEEAGEFDKGMRAIRPVAEQAAGIGYPPLIAEVLWVRGELETDLGDDASAERSLLESALAAERGRDGRAMVRARVSLAKSINKLGRSNEAMRWVELAEAGLSSIGDDPLLRAQVDGARGWVLESLGRWDEAREQLERMLSLRERVLGPRHRAVAIALHNLGVIAHDQGRSADALAYYRRALEVLVQALGASHPDVAMAMNNLGSTLSDLGRRDEALDTLRAALTLRLRTLGPEHRHVASTRMDLGRVLRLNGDLQLATEEEEAALRIGEAALSSTHPWLAWPLIELAEIHLARKEPAQALLLLERALTLPPRKRPRKPEVTFPLARALWESGGDRKRAHDLVNDAIAAYDPKVAADAEELGRIRRWTTEHAVPIAPAPEAGAAKERVQR